MPFIDHNEYETKRGFNYKFVALVLGLLSLFQTIFLLICLGVSLHYHDDGFKALLTTISLNFVVGLPLALYGKGQNSYDTGRREGMVTVTLSWVLTSLLGMMPYLLGGFIPNVSEAFFESMSGFSTTGASILTDIEAQNGRG